MPDTQIRWMSRPFSYDDSDGWYDHQIGPIMNTSTGTAVSDGTQCCGGPQIRFPVLIPRTPMPWAAAVTVRDCLCS